MKYHFILFILLLICVIPLKAQKPEGSFESVIQDHSKNIVTLSSDYKYKEVEYRWHEGEWRLKCTYIGKWSLVGDTIVKTRSTIVVWHAGDTTHCRPQDDHEQPGCCYAQEYHFDKNSLWNYGPMSQTKYVFTKKKE